MALIKVPDRGGNKEQVNKILKKAKTKKTATSVRTGGGLIGRIKEIENRVNSDLGKYAEESLLINTQDALHDYISKCIDNHVIAIDTETTGLDPLQDDIVGFSIYTPNEKTAYIPINHISYITQQKSVDQLSVDICKEELQRIADAEIEVIMFNAAFDTRVIMNHIGVRLICTWDCSIGAKCLNENEAKGQGGLKPLHQKYVLKGVGDAFKFDDLFKGVTFNLIPIKFGYLYAAHDAKITYELYEYQKPYLTYDPTCEKEARNGLNGVAWVFHNIEMPCVQAVVDMENVGVAFDFDKNAEFKVKYHTLLEEKETAFHELCKPYADKIQAYANEGKIENPINIRSTQQLPILLYDIAKIPPILDKKTKQPLLSTGEEILSQIDHPLCKAILEYRSFEKLVSTYIDKLPECVNPKDKRIHAKFNQYGAKCITGDSIVLTDKGYVQISKLFEDTDKDDEMICSPITIVNKDLIFEQASHRVMYHNKDTVKLVLRGGYEIEGTPNHPVVVSDITLEDIQRNKSDKQIRRLGETRHFEQLSNIKVGDTVAIPYGYNIFPTEYVRLDCNLVHTKTYNSRQCTMPEYCNEEFAELLGMYHADGTYKHQMDKFIISIHNKDKDVIDRVKYLAKSLFNIDAYTYTGEKTVSTIISSLQIQEVEKYLVKGARNKCVPSIIMQSPKSVVCAYIKGLTLDSSFDKDRQRLFISCMNRDAFNFLQSALLNIGILTQVRYGRDEYTRDHMGNEVNPINTRRLGISGEMYGKFLSEIGFVQSSKRLCSEKYKKSQYLTYNNVYYAYVKDIQYGNADVYDIHVPNTHSFIANGLINHNTGRFSSSDPNAQNIPARNKEIRQMFKATDEELWVEETDNSFVVDKWSEVKTDGGWKYADKVESGDKLVVSDNDKQSYIFVNKTSVVVDKNQIIIYY